ncbi:MAG: phenylalanine--tRNA ligase beta subunit-related protein [Thermotaleaceae bacterium]
MDYKMGQRSYRHMIEIRIDKKLQEACPGLTLGCIEAKVKVKQYDAKLWEEISNVCNQLTGTMIPTDIAKLKNIQEARSTYRKLGQDPTRYRVSSEALLRRVIKDKGLYQINNIVDINNLISLQSYHPVCTYDQSKIQKSILFTVGEEGEAYQGIGRGSFSVEFIPVFADTAGKFGSTTSDSERAMVTEETQEILLCIVSFNGDDKMEHWLKEGERLLLRYGDGEDVQTRLMKF